MGYSTTRIKSAKILTLFEYDHIDSLSLYETRAIARLSQKMGVEVLKPTLRNGKISFQARQFVGVLRLGQRTLQVLPKIHRSTIAPQDSINEASCNLLWMLDYAGYLTIKESNLASLQRTHNWFETLIYLFASHLKRQWLQSAHLSYQTLDAVLPVLKGKWRIPAQMRRPEQQHRFAVSYDEFTHDNPLNRLLRYVVELLWKLTRDSQNRQLLSDLRYWMDDVTLLPTFPLSTAQTIQLTRLNQHYQPLLNLALLFLQHLGLSLSANDQTSFAFMFDMNRLFESFLTRFLQRHRRAILPESLKASRILPQSHQATLHLAQHQSQPVFRLKPDIVLRNPSGYPMLMDVKYKRLNPSDRTLGITAADLYQMTAYLQRFATPQVILIYPQTVGMPQPIRAHFSLQATPGTIRAVTVDLLKDLSQKKAEQELVLELKQILATAPDHE
jgi:5-methylcytosine-specific restriction enzyme subunit McrC